MGFSDNEKEEIKNILFGALRHKFRNYSPESKYMPFHMRLLGKDRMALFSFIRSLNTNFGTSIFEPISAFLGSEHFKSVEVQTNAGEYITKGAQECIQNIIDNLTSATTAPNSLKEIEMLRDVCQMGEVKKIKSIRADIKLTSLAPNSLKEIEMLRDVCQMGEVKKIKSIRADIKLTSFDDSIYLIDLKTAKPNKRNFISFKRNFLEWIASILYINPDAKINTFLGIPYNPYYPNPYARWTLAGMFDVKNELKVGEEYWDFIGGEGAYHELLDIFENVGIKMREEIDEYFASYQ